MTALKLPTDRRIFIAGHKGMVGSAIERLFLNMGYRNLLLADRATLDLQDQAAVNRFLADNRPDCVILAAAKVGGIQANIRNPASFLYENLVIQNNVINGSLLNGVKQFVFLGSSCIYPKSCPQPMKEEYLLTGPLEPTNEGYALAKIAGLKLTQLYQQRGLKSINLMPCNLYGPNDSFDLENSHVLSALVKRFVDATIENKSELVLWGSGRARREFMHVDDLARAILHFLNRPQQIDILNVGWGSDISIKELALMIAAKTGFGGKILWDESKPNGMLRKCMDVTRMNQAGFFPTIDLETGITQMISLYKSITQHTA